MSLDILDIDKLGLPANKDIRITGFVSGNKLDNLVFISPGFDHFTETNFVQQSFDDMIKEKKQFLAVEFLSEDPKDTQKLLENLKRKGMIDKNTRIDFVGHGEYKKIPINAVSININEKLNEDNIKEKILNQAKSKENLYLPIFYQITENYNKYVSVDFKKDPTTDEEIFDFIEKDLSKDEVPDNVEKISSEETLREAYPNSKIEKLKKKEKFPVLFEVPCENIHHYSLYQKDNRLTFEKMDYSGIYDKRAKERISNLMLAAFRDEDIYPKSDNYCDADTIDINANVMRYLAQAKESPFKAIHKAHVKTHYLDKLRWFPNNKGNDVNTADVLKDLQEKLQVENFHLWSCHGGASKYDVNQLKEGSSLIIHSGTKYSIPIASLFDTLHDSMDIKAEFESFLKDSLESPETINFISKTKDKVVEFKACAPKGPLPLEDLKKYLENQADNFIDFVSKNFSPEKVALDKLNQIKTDFLNNEKNIKKYMAKDFFIETNRPLNKDLMKYLKYIEYGADLDAPIMGQTIREGLGDDILSEIQAYNKKQNMRAPTITTAASIHSNSTPFQSLSESEKVLYKNIKNKLGNP